MTTEENNREDVRRRLMFVPGEDFYFLTYTTLLVLGHFDCTRRERPFHDSTKISYLADLIGGDADLNLALATTPVDARARARLSVLHDRAVARRAPLTRVLEALARREWIGVHREAGTEDIFLIPSDEVKRLQANDAYQSECIRLERIRKAFPQLRSMKTETMRDRLFTNHGVRTWPV